MTTDTLAAALEHEHHQIDRAVGGFLAARPPGHDQAQPLRAAIAALRRHIFLEEEFLFPPLREAGLVAPIFVMLREHGEMWNTIDAVDAQLSDDALEPASELCQELLAQLDRHNSKEESIVYPQADAVLSASADAALRTFLAAGRMPDGWVCAQAGA